MAKKAKKDKGYWTPPGDQTPIPPRHDVMRTTEIFDFVKDHLHDSQFIQQILQAEDTFENIGDFRLTTKLSDGSTFTFGSIEEYIPAVMAIVGHCEEAMGVFHNPKEIQLYRYEAERYTNEKLKTRDRKRYFDKSVPHQLFYISYFDKTIDAYMDDEMQAMLFAGTRQDHGNLLITAHAPHPMGFQAGLTLSERFNPNRVELRTATAEDKTRDMGENAHDLKPNQRATLVGFSTGGPYNALSMRQDWMPHQGIIDQMHEINRSRTAHQYPSFPTVQCVYQVYLQQADPAEYQAMCHREINRAATKGTPPVILPQEETAYYRRYVQTHQREDFVRSLRQKDPRAAERSVWAMAPSSAPAPTAPDRTL